MGHPLPVIEKTRQPSTNALGHRRTATSLGYKYLRLTPPLLQQNHHLLRGGLLFPLSHHESIATGTVVEVDVDTRRGRILCRILTRRGCRIKNALGELFRATERPSICGRSLSAITLDSTIHSPIRSRWTRRSVRFIRSGAPQTDASTQPALGDGDDPTITVFHHTLRFRPDCDNLARFVRVNSRWAWGPGHRLLWASSPSLVLPSPVHRRSTPSTSTPDARSQLAFVYFDFTLRSTRRRTLRAMVSRFGLGTRTPVALGISPFLRLTLPRPRRFASRALTLTALHFIRLFFFSTWIRTGRIAA
ncbi:hypothetical protein R3P38DRAFT_3186895 [Favolaschia claudopus]|uniref:Uncharacterized protein n=1 Tax=Favolaschia claudopus TaxID=2862362 RepID=A0AAW0C1U6_9AGAR